MSLDDADRRLAQQRRTRLMRLLSILVPVVVFALFLIKNEMSVPLDFLLFKTNTSLLWIMFICAILGGVVGYFVGKPGHLGRQDKQSKKDDPKP